MMKVRSSSKPEPLVFNDNTVDKSDVLNGARKQRRCREVSECGTIRMQDGNAGMQRMQKKAHVAGLW